ncbi:MAG TPA: hypothetical protein VNA15_02995 [Candidatus Angelobacter sp.]|nr:hypothetical protein [Candidatus Angelobacter sp.]
MSQDDKKKRFWQVDPAIFKLGRRAGSVERYLLPALRGFGRYVLYALALFYPITLAVVGLVYGGLAFWTYFVGSFAVIGLIISKLGYARNFDRWNVSSRTFAAIFVAFIALLGFFAGLIYLKVWFVPIVFGGLYASFFLTLERSRVWHLMHKSYSLLKKKVRSKLKIR